VENADQNIHEIHIILSSCSILRPKIPILQDYMNSRSNGYGGSGPKGFAQTLLSAKDIFSGENGGAGKFVCLNSFLHPHLTTYVNTVQAGVGVFFQQESDGNVYVKTIVSGGAAERDGLIQIGDIIVAVDDREVIQLFCSSSTFTHHVHTCKFRPTLTDGSMKPNCRSSVSRSPSCATSSSDSRAPP
jgi:hypothetical protein